MEQRVNAIEGTALAQKIRDDIASGRIDVAVEDSLDEENDSENSLL